MKPVGRNDAVNFNFLKFYKTKKLNCSKGLLYEINQYSKYVRQNNNSLFIHLKTFSHDDGM